MPKPQWVYSETNDWTMWRSTAGPGYLSFIRFRDPAGRLIFSAMSPFPAGLCPDTPAFSTWRRWMKKRAYQRFLKGKKMANA